MNYKWVTKHIVYGLLTMHSVAVFAQEPQKKTNNDLGLFQQGVELSADGKWQNAEKIFREVAKRNPSWPEPKNNLAVALYKSGKLEQAQQALEDAVTSLPSFRIAQSNRQRLYDYSATVAYYKAVGINEKPGQPKLELLKEVKGTSSIVTRLAPAVVSKKADNTDEVIGQVKSSLIKWSQSWSNSDVEQYLSAYSSHFKPSDSSKNYTQWRKQRRDKLRFTKVDRITLDRIQVYMDASKQQALVEFVQHYQSAKYQDKVLKQVRLAYENDNWLIVSENVLQQLN